MSTVSKLWKMLRKWESKNISLFSRIAELQEFIKEAKSYSTDKCGERDSSRHGGLTPGKE